MHRRFSCHLLVLGCVIGTAWPAAGQALSPPPAAVPEYVFLDTVKTGTMAKELEAAGQQGYAIHSASLLCLLLKRGDPPVPRVYRLVATTRETTLAKELGDLGAQGFRVVPASVMQFAGEWVMALEQQPQGARFSYDVVRGDDQLGGKLAALRRQGGTIAGIVGKTPGEWSFTKPVPILIIERAQDAVPAGDADRQYRVSSTEKSSTLLKEVQQFAAEGFSPIGAGFMTIVMERDPQAPPDKVEYQMVAAMRVKTIEKEVNAFGAAGYRVAPRALFVRQSGNSLAEVVIFMRRPPGATVPYAYRFLLAKEETINTELHQQEDEGFLPVGLVGGTVAILEKAPKTAS